MTYDYDEAVAIPMVQMYDTDMMRMYLSAAKDEYERALADQDKFAKEFGDLYSSNSDLNQAYYDATKGRVNKAMDYLYQNGIDPVRSAEGRAYIQKIIRETPYAKIANWKSDAENIKTYDKMKAQMIAEGKYDPGYEQFSLQEAGLGNWNPNGDRRWDRLSPVEYKDMTSRVKPYSDSIEDGLLTEDDVKALGYAYNPDYDYLGKSIASINEQSGLAAQAFAKTPQGRYELQRIKDQMIQNGTPITDAQAMQLYSDQVRSNMTVRPRMKDKDVDKMAQMRVQQQYSKELENLRSANSINEYKNKAAIDYQYALLESQNGIKGGRSKGGSGSKDNTWNIFDEMDSQPGSTVSLDVNVGATQQGIVPDDPMVEVEEYKNKADLGGGYSRSITISSQNAQQGLVKYQGFTKKRTKNGPAQYRQGEILVNDPKDKSNSDKKRQITTNVISADSQNKFAKDKVTGKYYELYKNSNTGDFFWLPIHKGYIGSAKNSDNK